MIGWALLCALSSMLGCLGLAVMPTTWPTMTGRAAFIITAVLEFPAGLWMMHHVTTHSADYSDPVGAAGAAAGLILWSVGVAIGEIIRAIRLRTNRGA